MIKFMMTRDGRKCLGICIVARNVELLKENKPIHFSAEELGKDEIKVKDIAIFYAETEEDFKKWLIDNGLISDKTIIHDVDRTVQ